MSGVNSILNTMEVLASGMAAARLRVNTLASNIANAETTRTQEGGPYKERRVVQVVDDVPGSFSSALDRMTLKKPRIAGVVEDQSPPKLVHQPGHPDADEKGFVAYPNINVVATMTDLMSASRLYQANVTAVETARMLHSEASKILTQA
jgi:flagellar basal-body rod protein FlgC